jgi:phage protein D
MTVEALPDFDIKVNGTSLPVKARRDIRSVTVHEDVTALSMFTIELYNWDEEDLKVSWSDSQFFTLGNEVEISLGYLDKLGKVLLAEITSLEPTFNMGQTPMLVVRGYDHRHRLMRDRKTRSFSKMKDSAIAGQVARDAGLRAQVKDSKVALAYVAQSNQTDLEFLRARARRIGYEVYVKDKVLYFQPPQNAGRATVTLTLEDDITEFTPRLSAMAQVGEVAVRGWDVKQKKEIVGKAGVGQESGAMGGKASGPKATNRALGKAASATVSQPIESKAEADQMALGQFNAMALGYIQGDLVCYGRPQLRAGIVVDIQGAGTTFSGPYYVTSVVHTVTPDDGYQTTLNVQRNAS